ncbi:CEP83-like protein [Mya arenaria]|uniref:CEP83-like protein n=1 Tax=Mya arenaria TaxID=6604 RepID=A0ABY7G096_MYAAR|nr:CEP83-like protein [Mya arenaria]
MTDESIRLRNQVELLREELRLTKDQYGRAHDNHEHILSQAKSALIEEKTRLELRYKSKSTRVIENLKYKAQVLDGKREELELEKQALQSCVPQNTYNSLKKQLKDLHRRHTEFKRVLLSSGVQQERRHQEDLKLLRQRLDLLDDNQQQQLGEFAEIATSTE